jgi:hypothetical protein
MPFENSLTPHKGTTKHPQPPLPALRPVYPATLPLRTVCRIVSQITAEMIALLSDRVVMRRDHRRLSCHIRQIAMYVCHVALRMPQHDIAVAVGRDRSTVSHACHVVEDRRDDLAFDEFVSLIERLATAVFASQGFSAVEGGGHE